ncbi:inositol monophosphatase family protein [Vibrio ouci]|nr:inositol monophosphatase [Vibrio ouci]
MTTRRLSLEALPICVVACNMTIAPFSWSQATQQRHDFCLSIIKTLAQYQCRYTVNSQDIAIKSDASPVSIADIESERIFRDAVTREFASDSVQGEELGQTEPSQFNWVIDPIDGTRKFIRGIPTWGISIALEYRGHVVAAAICLPATGDVWSAVYQQGAFKNNQPIQVSEVAEINDAYITTSARKYFVEIGQQACYDAVHCQALHDPGFLDVYSFAMLCDGRIDGIVSCQDHWWDIAAATLILSESGGCYHFSSEQDRPDNGVNIFTNGKLRNQLSTLINTKEVQI